MTVNVSVLVAEPLVVSTLTWPLAAPGGTVKVTLVALTLVGTVTTLPSMTPTVPPRLRAGDRHGRADRTGAGARGT